jgi:hypothetical protein
MLTAMRGVMQEIEQQKRHDKAHPPVCDRPGGQSNAESCFELGPECIRRSKSETGEDNIEEPNAEITEPPLQRRKFPLPPRLANFP